MHNNTKRKIESIVLHCGNNSEKWHYFVNSEGCVKDQGSIYEIKKHCFGLNSESVSVCLEGPYPTIKAIEALPDLFNQIYMVLNKRIPIYTYRGTEEGKRLGGNGPNFDMKQIKFLDEFEVIE